jgi:hypothetical protein
VIVHHFDPLRVALPPHETDPKLIVDPYAVLPPPISTKCLEMVAREREKVLKSLRRVELYQLALSDPGDSLKPPRRITPEERLGISIPEGPDHRIIV